MIARIVGLPGATTARIRKVQPDEAGDGVLKELREKVMVLREQTETCDGLNLQGPQR